MKKLIMILAILCMIGATVIGMMNKKFFEETLANLKITKAKVIEVTAELGNKEQEKTEKDTVKKDRKFKRDEILAVVGDAEQNVKNLQRKLKDNQESLERKDIEFREGQMAINKIFPDGNVQTPAELQMILTMHDENLSTNLKKKESLEMQLQSLLQQQQTQLGRVGEEEEYQLKRLQRIVLGGLEATVVAVNPEWGFVMVNAGQNHGVEPDKSLIVERGTSRIARLRIINLQPNVVVCDIVKGSLTKGMNVQAGDKVIFENPFQ